MSLYLGTNIVSGAIQDAASKSGTNTFTGTNTFSNTITGTTSGNLDTNASNATSTGKTTIVGWGMPDYSALVSYTAGNAVPSNGFVFIAAYGYDHFPSISVNGVTIIQIGAGNYNCTTSSVIPVYSGDRVTHTGTLVSSYFAPCKGV